VRERGHPQRLAPAAGPLVVEKMGNSDYLKRYASKSEQKGKKEKKKRKNGQNEGILECRGGKAASTLIVDDDNWGEERREVNANLQEERPLGDDAPAMKQRGGWTEEETRPRRAVPDSDSDADIPRRPARKRRYSARDSDSDGNGNGNGNGNGDVDNSRRPTRTRHDSDSDAEVPRRPSAKSTASSGIQTGLISSSEFKAIEKDLLMKRQEEMKDIDEVAMGKGVGTVYRDESGNKVDTMSEYLRKEAIDKGVAIRLEKAQKSISQGGVQQRERLAMMEEMEKVALEGFSRTVDNERIETLRKEQMREGDPMAEFFSKRKRNRKSSGGSISRQDGNAEDAADAPSTANTKPRYTGPPPAPNRFNIAPGFRWDAVDRSNGFEAKVLLMLNKSNERSEQSYRAAVADM
jgi:pre-mRNA-splicing factor CWC26